MKVDILVISLAFCVLHIPLIARSDSSISIDPFLGISPQDEKLYKSSSSEIKCRDGSKKFTRAQLNDDFCDCPDGTDEPGTSACPNGKFYCRNAGHSSKLLFSSRVNDGICDCCDGSDEYDGKVKCTNTCWEAGKAARDKLNKKIATYKEGIILRKREVEQAKAGLAKDEEELTKLKYEEKILKDLVEQLKDHKERIDKEEEKERLQKEKEENIKREAEEAANPKTDAHDYDVIGNLEEHPADQGIEAEVEKQDFKEDLPVNVAEQQAVDSKVESLSSEHKDGSAVASDTDRDAEHHVSAEVSKVEQPDHEPQNTEGLSKEELGRLVGSRWTGEKGDKETMEADAAKGSGHDNHEETPKNSDDQGEDEYASDTDEDLNKYEDNDVEDEADESYEDEDPPSSSYKSDVDDEDDLSVLDTTSNPSWLEKIQKSVKNIMQAVNIFQTPVDKSDAARIRMEYDESSAKLSKIQSRISSLTKKLKRDFGPDKEFYSFNGHCFESKQNKYTYKVCPYKEASQVEGYSTTRLGNWDKFEDSYRFMVFSSGDKCWNGPDRSLKVKLRCGLKVELTDIDEPSRCEYVGLMSTPALCLETTLKDLQQKLDLMNTDQPPKHDEL